MFHFFWSVIVRHMQILRRLLVHPLTPLLMLSWSFVAATGTAIFHESSMDGRYKCSCPFLKIWRRLQGWQECITSWWLEGFAGNIYIKAPAIIGREGTRFNHILDRDGALPNAVFFRSARAGPSWSTRSLLASFYSLWCQWLSRMKTNGDVLVVSPTLRHQWVIKELSFW